MKSQFARIKNRASSVSTRALAVMLCFVMLLTAVGAGTMMTAIAAGGVTTPVADAAQKVIDIADSVDVSAAAAAEDEAPTETVFDKLKKQCSEIASTGSEDEEPAPKRKKTDLAKTGADHYIDNSKIIYFVNTYGWSGVKMHCWHSNGNWDNTMTRVGETGIYKWQNGNSHYDLNGFQFQNSSNSSNNTSNFYDTVTNDKVYWPNSATDDTTQMNGTAKVVSMIKDPDTNKYVKAADARCVATITSQNVSGGSASTTTGSTGASADTATCYPAYDATITYTESHSGIYQFDGFSTTSSATLPAGVTSTKSQKSTYRPDNKVNVSTVYAYFSKVEYPVRSLDTASSVSSGTLLIWGHDSKFYTNGRTWVFGTGMTASRNIKMASIGTIHKIDNSMINTGDPIDDDYAPHVYLTNGTGTTQSSWPGGDSQWNIYAPGSSESGAPSYTLSNSDAVYYNDSTNTKWNNFSHLAATAPTLKYNNATVTEVNEIDSEVTVSTTLSGTLSDDSATVKFYYTKDGTTKEITGNVTVSSKTYSINFYPPEYGSYTITAVAKDSKNVETVHSSTSTLSVGEGYYVTGTAALIGTTAWTYYPSKGEMDETATAGVWQVVFPSVSAGDHEFRITNLAEADHYVTDGNNVSVSGTASPTIVDNNVKFSLLGKSRVTITFSETKDSNNKYPVTVDVAEVVGMPVTVYANTGGTCSVTVGNTNYSVEEGSSNSFTVGEGEEIYVEAIANTGYEFDHWTKNLSRNYSTNRILTSEVITTKTVYVAAFSQSGSTEHPSASDGATAYTGSLHGLLGPGDNLKNSGTNYDNLKLYTLDNKLYAYVYVGSSEVLNKTQSNDTTVITGKNYYFGVSSSNSGNDLYYQGDGKSVTCAEAGSSGKFQRVQAKEWGGSHIGQFEVLPAGLNGYLRIELGSLTNNSTLTNTTTGTYKVKYIPIESGSGPVTETIFDPIMNFYAKDSAFSGQSTTELSYLGSLDTTVTNVTSLVEVDSSASSGKNYECGLALKGATITVSTTIPHTGSLTALKSDGTTETVAADDKYYVVGYCFNGVTPEILAEQDGRTGGTTYTCSYKIPDTIGDGILEITPIFFIKEKYASNCATFYINGYEDMLKSGGSNWGNTLFIYPFYKYRKNNTNSNSGDTTTYSGQAENFGAYPGQPVINYGGQLYTQIPLTCNGTIDGIDTYGNPIKGVTINNGYFDGCHNNLCGFVSEHQQTYDYDDFQKIVKEKSTQNGSKYLHSVYFSFKYHAEDTTHQHRSYSTTSVATGDTRYNDMLAAGKPGASPTVATLKSSVENTTNKFEYLTDALGNPVDLFGTALPGVTKDTPIANDALWVVSLGYEKNNSGQYATEWAVYHTSNGSNLSLVYDSTNSIDSTNTPSKDYNSSIVPSALVMNGSASFANYAAMDGDQAITGYKNLYTALESYRNKPVMICYEYDAYINYNSPHAYRSDGRWSYTTVNDYVKSNIKIQYSTDGLDVNDTAKVWTDDSFDSGTNKGTTTKTRAYFTNSSYYGLTESTSQIISNKESDNYKFTAEPSGSYVFAGWYLQDVHGKISTITNDYMSAETRRSGNFTMIARFQYVADGNLMISHTLAGDSTGRGTTYLGVYLSNGSEDVTLANSASNTEPVTIGRNYIKSNSSYVITIELRTVVNGENTFVNYTCTYTDGNDVVHDVSTDTDYYKDAKKTLATSSYEDIDIPTVIFGGDTTQDIKGIEYISHMNAVHYNYNIKYQFTSRNYGNMQYTQSGSLSAGEIGDEDIVTRSGANRYLSKTFLADKAPYESNFMKDINWNFDYAGITQTTTYAGGSNTYTIDVKVPVAAEEQTAQNPIRTAYVTVPYALAANKNGVAAIVGDTASGYVNMVGEVETPLTFSISAPYDSYVKDSDEKTLTAPATLLATNDAGAEVVKYFQYWEVKDHNSTRTESGYRTLFKCFFPSFNYRLLGNYDIEAIYTEDPLYTFSDLYAAENNTTSIVFIGNSRNQWNGGKNIDGGMNTSAPNNEGDIVYSDFILAFKPAGTELIKDIAGAEYGLVIQKINTQIATDANGRNLYNLLQYEEQNKSTESTAKTSAEAVAGGSTVSGFAKKRLNTNGNAANDKNRMHYAYAMNNKFVSGEMTNCKYLYRAFSYMIVNDVVTVSDKPAYFYMYDEAIK